eukprot:768117-Hanusia_phi.AAC.3
MAAARVPVELVLSHVPVPRPLLEHLLQVGGPLALHHQQVLDIESLSPALPDLQVPRVRVQQVEDLLVVDFEASRFHRVLSLPPPPLHLRPQLARCPGDQALPRIAAMVLVVVDHVLGSGYAVRLPAPRLPIRKQRRRVAVQRLLREAPCSTLVVERRLIRILVDAGVKHKGLHSQRLAEVLLGAALQLNSLPVLQQLDHLLVAPAPFCLAQGTNPQDNLNVLRRRRCLHVRSSVCTPVLAYPSLSLSPAQLVAEPMRMITTTGVLARDGEMQRGPRLDCIPTTTPS